MSQLNHVAYKKNFWWYLLRMTETLFLFMWTIFRRFLTKLSNKENKNLFFQSDFRLLLRFTRSPCRQLEVTPCIYSCGVAAFDTVWLSSVPGVPDLMLSFWRISFALYFCFILMHYFINHVGRLILLWSSYEVKYAHW